MYTYNGDIVTTLVESVATEVVDVGSCSPANVVVTRQGRYDVAVSHTDEVVPSTENHTKDMPHRPYLTRQMTNPTKVLRLRGGETTNALRPL